MKICPNCVRVLSYNSYFGDYICDACSWEEVSKGTKKTKDYSIIYSPAKRIKSNKTTARHITAFKVPSN